MTVELEGEGEEGLTKDLQGEEQNVLTRRRDQSFSPLSLLLANETTANVYNNYRYEYQ